jgi:hypothetical protein
LPPLAVIDCACVYRGFFISPLTAISYVLPQKQQTIYKSDIQMHRWISRKSELYEQFLKQSTEKISAHSGGLYPSLPARIPFRADNLLNNLGEIRTNAVRHAKNEF